MKTCRHRFSLEGKVALITGASRGLGRQMALAFAEAGADVAVASRKNDACEQVAGEIQAMGRRAFPYACHAGKWEQIDTMIEAVYDHFGKVDILVNNAGMSPPYASLADVTEPMWDSVFALNLKGPFRLSVGCAERMAKAGGGVIINISSIAAVRPSPVEVPYAAAKAGLNNLTAALAEVYGPKVRVNCIMAGPFLTDVSKAWDMDAAMKKFQTSAALQRPGSPEEIIGSALYFASDASSFTTGAVLAVDGGYRR